MPDRFYVTAFGVGDTVELTGEEAHHLARVRRIGRGETVQLFDGLGVECTAVVREIVRGSVLLSIEQRSEVSRELPFALTLGCSPAKGDRLRWLVEKATELGVSRFVPIVVERSSEQARGLRASKMERWVIEGSKQCGRNLLMQLSEPVGWQEFLQLTSRVTTKLLADPSGTRLNSILPETTLPREVALAVGPEGGFSDAELIAAEGAGWMRVSLGSRILRVETAAVALVSRVAADH